MGKLSLSAAAATAINSADTSATSSTTDRIEWSRSTILGFIEDYRRQRVLWDPNTKGYHIKQTKYDALKALGTKYGTEIRSIRSKIKSLRSSFHREHGKVINGRRRGVHYQPMWFAYEAIRFILDGEGGGAVAVGAEEESLAAACGARVVGKDEQQGEEKPEVDDIALDKLDEEEDEEQSSLGEDYAELLKIEAKTVFSAATSSSSTSTAAVTAAAVAPAVKSTITTAPKTETIMPIATATTKTTALAASMVRATAMNLSTGGGGGIDDSNIISRAAAVVAAAAVAAAAAAGGAGMGRSTDDPHNADVPQCNRASIEIDGDSQCYCPIRAEDVKTEIIENDSLDLSMVVRAPSDMRTFSTPSPTPSPLPLNYNKHSANSRKRKTDDNTVSPTTKRLYYQQQQQQQHSTSIAHTRSQQHAFSPTTTTTAAAAAATATTSASGTPKAAAANSSNGSSWPADEYGVFGEYVAITIRRLKTSKAKIVIKHLINNLLYEAELGKYDHGMPASKEPPQLYRT